MASTLGPSPPATVEGRGESRRSSEAPQTPMQQASPVVAPPQPPSEQTKKSARQKLKGAVQANLFSNVVSESLVAEEERILEELVGVHELSLLHDAFVEKPPPSSPVEKTEPTSPVEQASSSVEKTKALTEDEFVTAAVAAIPQLTQDRARQFYWRVDADNTKEVTWEEFSTFVLSRGQRRTASDQKSSFFSSKSNPTFCHSFNRHSDMITQVIVHPRYGFLLTSSRDGSIKKWDTRTLQHQKLVYQGGSWITDMCFMRNAHRAAACTVDRKIIIIDAKSCEVVRTFGGRRVIDSDEGLRYVFESTESVEIGNMLVSHAAPKNVRVTTANRASSPNSKISSKLRTLSFEQFKATMENERQKRVEKKKLELTNLAGLLDTPVCMLSLSSEVPNASASASNEDSVMLGTLTGDVISYNLPTMLQEHIVNPTYSAKIHNGAVNMIRIAPYINCFLTCSDDKTIKATNLETGQLIKTFIGHIREVHHIEWSEALRVFVSCGAERSILVWNHLQDAPIFRLSEHTAPLLCVRLNTLDQQVVSLSADMMIKVWDLKTYKCLQTITERMKSKEPDYSFMCYDKSDQRILCASTFPVQYQLKKKAATFPHHYIGHTFPVVAALYNPIFKQLVTLDNDCAILWNADNGQYCFYFSLNSAQGAQEDLRLTAVKFDRHGKRLVTGFHNGVVVVWNFSNGQPMNVIRDPTSNSMAEVHDVETLSRLGQDYYVMSVGNKLIVAPETHQFTVTDVSRWTVPKKLGFVVCLTTVSPQVVAGGTSSGAIIFFHIRNESLEGRPLVLADYDEGPMPSPTSRALLSAGESSEEGPSAGGLSTSSRIERIQLLNKIGKVIMSCHADGKVAMWNHQKRSFLQVMSLANGAPTVSNIVAESVDNEYVACSDDHGNVHIWKLVVREKDRNELTPAVQATIAPSETSTGVFSFNGTRIHSVFRAHATTITMIEWIRTVSLLLVTTSVDATARLFNISGSCLGTYGMKAWSTGIRTTWEATEPAAPVGLTEGLSDSVIRDIASTGSGTPKGEAQDHQQQQRQEEDQHAYTSSPEMAAGGAGYKTTSSPEDPLLCPRLELPKKKKNLRPKKPLSPPEQPLNPSQNARSAQLHAKKKTARRGLVKEKVVMKIDNWEDDEDATTTASLGLPSINRTPSGLQNALHNNPSGVLASSSRYSASIWSGGGAGGGSVFMGESFNPLAGGTSAVARNPSSSIKGGGGGGGALGGSMMSYHGPSPKVPSPSSVQSKQQQQQQQQFEERSPSVKGASSPVDGQDLDDALRQAMTSRLDAELEKLKSCKSDVEGDIGRIDHIIQSNRTRDSHNTGSSSVATQAASRGYSKINSSQRPHTMQGTRDRLQGDETEWTQRVNTLVDCHKLMEGKFPTVERRMETGTFRGMAERVTILGIMKPKEARKNIGIDSKRNAVFSDSPQSARF